ncbi:MAG: flagellar M-ring protein FliF [Frateuria sp.]|uniref:flagellar basal-body MS-ring/collar protein FliF n=1 Tax=Frateuria sp. TaxID=2211372 RepID=UPI00180B7FAA|nr:flagellar basal-body MS-ring/collar protein FliF [Frateuria sp.]NUO73690.1 flagellar M-ring protein FliF [Frateuria sp.]NUR21577.1 flagellar M-ring protein FliF [Frateuria sp.]
MAENAIATTTDSSANRFDLRQLARSPASRQLLLLVGMAAAVALGVAVVLWSRGPNWGLLYAGLGQQDAAAITQALQSTNTPYQLGNDGSSIMVPASDLAAIRLRLAGQGLPQGTAASGAAPQADSPFGMSDLAERTRYQQALEADLGNTIGSLQGVRSARVHLAMAKPSAFIRDDRQASASVLVTLYPGRQLDASQVAAIVHLVAASVPDLDPRQVSVVDQQGQLLTGTDPDSATAVGDSRLRLATRMENTYAQRVEQLLMPLVGPGKVHAQVFVDLDFSQTEKATETYGHDHPALRSEQTSSERRGSGSAVDGGVPGALSNQPPVMAAQPTAANPNAGGKPVAPAAATAQADNSDSSSSATRNYELDRTISHTSDPAGRLVRLTVAVVVDNKNVAGPNGSTSAPFTAQELTHLTELTKNAVGFNAARGDSVSVVNQAFQQAPAADAPGQQPFWQRPGMLDLIKQAIGVLIALVVAFGLLRPLLKGLLRGVPQPALAGAGRVPTVSVRIADDQEDERSRLSAPAQVLGYEQKVGLARRMVSDNPKQVAQVVRNWVGEDGS